MDWDTFSYPDFKDVVLFVLAVYASILSTVNFRQTLQRDRRSIKVSLTTAMPTYGSKLGPPFVRIQATNSGHHVVSVTTLTLELPDGKRLMPFAGNSLPGVPDTPLPVSLAEGERAFLHISYADVGGALIEAGLKQKMKLTPVCEDSVGGEYRGKSWTIDPVEFVKMNH